MSRQCISVDRSRRCSRAILSPRQTLTPLSYTPSTKRAMVRIPFQQKFPARLSTVCTVLSR